MNTNEQFKRNIRISYIRQECNEGRISNAIKTLKAVSLEEREYILKYFENEVVDYARESIRIKNMLSTIYKILNDKDLQIKNGVKKCDTSLLSDNDLIKELKSRGYEITMRF